MWLILLTVAVTGVTSSELVSRYRFPVHTYAQHNGHDDQAVLIEPTTTLPPFLLQSLPLGGFKNHINKDVPPLSDTVSQAQEAAEGRIPPTSLAQTLPMRRPPLVGRLTNNSTNPLVSNLRKQLKGRTGMWRKSAGGAAGGLGFGSRRRRPGLSRLRSGAALGKRRRRPMGGTLTGMNQWKSAPGILHNRLAIPAAAEALTTTVKPSVEDFLSHWHNIYSRSQTKAQDTTVEQPRPTTEAPSREAPSRRTQPTASQNWSDRNNSGISRINQKVTQNLSPKHPYVSSLASVASIPSVHDMTSMHFKKKINSSIATNEKNGASKVKATKYSNRPAIRAEGTTKVSSTSIRTTPLPSKQPVMKPAPDGKHILDSIQSIFQAAKFDEHELSSMKNTNHGNTSPQPLDVFSGVPPTYGFVPSEQVQTVFGLGQNAIRSQVKESYVTPQDTSHPTMMVTTSKPHVELESQNIWFSSPRPLITDPVPQWAMGQNSHSPEMPPQNMWVTSENPFVSNLETKASNIEPSVLLSHQPSEDHIILHVGQSLPVHTEPNFRPEHRGGSEGDIILNEEPSDDVIIGRPAALIQAPPEDNPVVLTAPPKPQPTRHGNPHQSHFPLSNPSQQQVQFNSHPQPVMQSVNPAHSQMQFANPSASHRRFANHDRAHIEEPAPQHTSPDWNIEEIEPLVEFIKEKYDSQHIKTIPPSVTSLQSIINSGRIPDFFKKDEVMDFIRKDRIRNHNSAMNRMAQPWRNSVDKMGVHPKEKSDVGGSGQFVAISSLALVAALCGYLLYSASGAAREARRVLHPLKASLQDAREGLQTLIQGLDEYEEHLNEEEKEENEEEKVILQEIPVQSTSQEDIPTILKRIWNTVVPAEVRISSGTLGHATGNYKPVDASSLVRRNRPRQKPRSGFREPHAIQVPTSNKNDESNFDPLVNKTLSSLNESVIRPTMGLVSVANSFFNSLINRKTIESILSQLKYPVGSIGNSSSELLEPRIDGHDRFSLEQAESNSTQHISAESLTDEQNLTGKTEPQDLGVTTTFASNFEDVETLIAEDPLEDGGLVTLLSTGIQEEGLHEVFESHHDKTILQENIHHMSRENGHDVSNILRRRILEVPEIQKGGFQDGEDFHEAAQTQQTDYDRIEETVSEVTTKTTDEDLQESTVTPSTVQRRVILNNRLYIQHNPETDTPRTSAFVNNVPLKSISPAS